MALMLCICNPQPTWIPKNPKLMFQICQNRSRGLSITLPRCNDHTAAVAANDRGRRTKRFSKSLRNPDAARTAISASTTGDTKEIAYAYCGLADTLQTLSDRT